MLQVYRIKRSCYNVRMIKNTSIANINAVTPIWGPRIEHKWLKMVYFHHFLLLFFYIYALISKLCMLDMSYNSAKTLESKFPVSLYIKTILGPASSIKFKTSLVDK